MKKFFWSYQGFAVVMLLGVVLSAVTLLICSYCYKSGGFGLPPALVPVARASYLPALLAAGVGFQKAATYLMGFKSQPLVPIENKVGGGFNYLMGLSGVIFALVVLLIASFHWVSDENARALFESAAGFWGITVGFLFNTYFAQYAPSSPPSPSSAVAPQSPTNGTQPGGTT